MNKVMVKLKKALKMKEIANQRCHEAVLNSNKYSQDISLIHCFIEGKKTYVIIINYDTI